MWIQRFSSLKTPFNLPHVEILEGMQFWISWSKCCPGSHNAVCHLPKDDSDSTTKHCRYNWHWPSTRSFLFSVQFPAIGLNICRWPVPYVGHLVATNLPFWHNWYHSHSPCSGPMSSLLHSKIRSDSYWSYQFGFDREKKDLVQTLSCNQIGTQTYQSYCNNYSQNHFWISL